VGPHHNPCKLSICKGFLFSEEIQGKDSIHKCNFLVKHLCCRTRQQKFFFLRLFKRFIIQVGEHAMCVNLTSLKRCNYEPLVKYFTNTHKKSSPCASCFLLPSLSEGWIVPFTNPDLTPLDSNYLQRQCPLHTL